MGRGARQAVITAMQVAHESDLNKDGSKDEAWLAYRTC